MKKVALALGGGGARGFAHLKYLEYFDQENISVARISGASIGAVIGTLYASGKNARKIQEDLHAHLILEEDRKRDVLKKIPDMWIWLSKIRFDLKRRGIVRTEKFLEYLLGDLKVENFEDLQIPLTVVATDFWTGEEVIFDSGPLMPAIMASMAVPGIFPPVEYAGRVLVDGSLSNSVPYSHFRAAEEVSIAIDVAPERGSGDKKVPKVLEASLEMFDMLIDKLAHYQRAQCEPDIYFRPGIQAVGILEFDKIDTVYQQAEARLPEFKKQCGQYSLVPKI